MTGTPDIPGFLDGGPGDDLVADPGRCGHCGRSIRVTDAREIRTFGSLGAGAVHTACTEDGVRRWLREGKPHSDPLTASRQESWGWGRDPEKRGGFDSAASYALDEGLDPNRY